MCACMLEREREREAWARVKVITRNTQQVLNKPLIKWNIFFFVNDFLIFLLLDPTATFSGGVWGERGVDKKPRQTLSDQSPWPHCSQLLVCKLVCASTRTRPATFSGFYDYSFLVQYRPFSSVLHAVYTELTPSECQMRRCYATAQLSTFWTLPLHQV